MMRVRRVIPWLRVLSWRLPFVHPPSEIGKYLRYSGVMSPDTVDVMAEDVRRSLKRVARVGGVRLHDWRQVRHYPKEGSKDPYELIGSVGWKARVTR